MVHTLSTYAAAMHQLATSFWPSEQSESLADFHAEEEKQQLVAAASVGLPQLCPATTAQGAGGRNSSGRMQGGWHAIECCQVLSRNWKRPKTVIM